MKHFLSALAREWERTVFAAAIVLVLVYGSWRWLSTLHKSPAVDSPGVSVREDDIINPATAWVFLEQAPRIEGLQLLFDSRPAAGEEKNVVTHVQTGKPSPAPAEPAPEPLKLQYLGVIKMSTPVALILDPDTGHEYSRPAGGTIRDLIILSFDAQHLTLGTRQGTTIQLRRGHMTAIDPTTGQSPKNERKRQ